MLKIIKFSASWCGPCKMYAPIFKEISSELNEDYIFEDYDVDENKEMASKYGVMSIPMTVIVGENGEVKSSRNGMMSKNQLIQFINENR